MPAVWIPSLLRELTHGQEKVCVAGETVQDVVAHLEKIYPGIEDRLCADGKLRASIAVVVDGTTSKLRLRQPLTETSEVHFVLVISGG